MIGFIIPIEKSFIKLVLAVDKMRAIINVSTSFFSNNHFLNDNVFIIIYLRILKNAMVIKKCKKDAIIFHQSRCLKSIE
jgi:hypothetical protein